MKELVEEFSKKKTRRVKYRQRSKDELRGLLLAVDQRCDTMSFARLPDCARELLAAYCLEPMVELQKGVQTACSGMTVFIGPQLEEIGIWALEIKVQEVQGSEMFLGIMNQNENDIRWSASDGDLYISKDLAVAGQPSGWLAAEADLVSWLGTSLLLDEDLPAWRPAAGKTSTVTLLLENTSTPRLAFSLDGRLAPLRLDFLKELATPSAAHKKTTLQFFLSFGLQTRAVFSIHDLAFFSHHHPHQQEKLHELPGPGRVLSSTSSSPKENADLASDFELQKKRRIRRHRKFTGALFLATTTATLGLVTRRLFRGRNTYCPSLYT